MCAAALQGEIDAFALSLSSRFCVGVIARYSPSVRRPAAVDRQGGAGDRGCPIGAQEHGQRGQFLDSGEFLGRLRCQQHVADHLPLR